MAIDGDLTTRDMHVRGPGGIEGQGRPLLAVQQANVHARVGIQLYRTFASIG